MDDESLKDLLGFSTFGKRKHVTKQTKKKNKVTKIDYTLPTIEFYRPATRLELNDLEGFLDMDPPSVVHGLSRLQKSLETVLDMKNKLHALQLRDDVYRNCRSLANPFELVGKWRFVNRSAMKLAEIDACVQLMPSPEQNQSVSFVDLCGAPGGFSEYLVFRADRNHQSIRGHGISIKVPTSTHLDWHVSKKVLEKLQISYGADNTGDLYEQTNMDHFARQVLQAHSEGVDLVVADGGFQDARNQSNQESLMHRLVLCEILVMTRVLRKGGHFVCKSFELSSAISLGLLYVLHHLFSEIAIVKPMVGGGEI
ncbi:FtsJ methyltransferase domain-containing protein 2 [Aphanomyces cochlioides]|nr:FtsJ methyltransferase domain-containing protein 2 [Aphanomyces cochlioides]